MAEYTNIQLAQAELNTTVTQTVNSSRDYHETFGEGVMVTLVGMGVVFAVLIIMILFINLFKKVEPLLDRAGAFFSKNKGEAAAAAQNSQEAQNIDNTTLVLISAAVAAYTHNKARVRRIRVLPAKAKQGGNWAMQVRSALQSSHSRKQ